jgi:hypothetical protein
MNKKTWKCTLPGCAFFVHLGLAHVLEGKQGVCWQCGEQFTLTETALRDEMPKCDDCRTRTQGMPSLDELNDIIEQKIALAKQGVQSVDELTPQKRRSMEALGLIKPALKTPEELAEIEKEDKIESEE